MKRALYLLMVTFVTFALLYISRFWIFMWWDRLGLFGFKALPPQGGWLQRWLRGTDLAPFELLIWVIAGFLLLTLLQKLFDKLKSTYRLYTNLALPQNRSKLS